MLNVILIVFLIVTLCLIVAVLLQRSEGGALGIGGGGGGVVSARGAASALTRVTWGLGIAFMVIAMALTVLGQRGTSTSVISNPNANAPLTESAGDLPLPVLPDTGEDGALPLPDIAPATPPSAD